MYESNTLYNGKGKKGEGKEPLPSWLYSSRIQKERSPCPLGYIHQEFSLFHLELEGMRACPSQWDSVSLSGSWGNPVFLATPAQSGTCIKQKFQRHKLSRFTLNFSRFFWKKCFPTCCMLWEQLPQTLHGGLLLLLLCIPGMKLLPSLLSAWFQWEFLCLYNLTPESNALGWAPHPKQSRSLRSWSWD